MKIKIITISSIILASISFIYGKSIKIENECITRSINLSENNINSLSINLYKNDENFIAKSREFFFLANDKQYTGNSNWDIVDVKQSEIKNGSKTTVITLRENSPTPSIELKLNYATYPNLPLIRKWIEFKNIGIQDVKLESLNIEDLQCKLYSVHSVVYRNYARMKHLMKFEGDWDDSVSVIHNVPLKRGIALGNEAMSVLKRSAFHTKENNIEIGLTHKDSQYPFRKWIKPDQIWVSPKVFICLYDNRNDGFEVVNNEVNKFVTNYMGTRVVELKHKPTFVYNTWYPFKSFIDEDLVRETAKAAAQCGIGEYVIDDGWQYNADKQSAKRGAGQNYGDWLVDENKFPNGLKPVFDYIKSLGMKPGLWLSIASANIESDVYKNHPEWFVEDKLGNHANLHNKGNLTMRTASLGTDWKNYIKDVILRLVKEHGLEYAKLDLAVATSAYYNDVQYTGSYSKNHPDYRDQPESFIVFYENLLDLFDQLHEQAPNLFIDCTFETAGKVQLMDYAIAKHAEGNWLSNFEGNAPDGSLRVRQMAWWRSPAMPASSLVIGNMAMDDPNFILTLKSLIGTLPIVLGDPRKLSDDKKAEIKQWADWLSDMQSKYDYMSFRKDLKGFGEPQEGYWDGWQRLNFNTLDGGIFGVFRQASADISRVVVLDDLKPDCQYLIKKAPNGEELCKASGKVLMEDGITITLSKKYDGDIFEVFRID